MKGLLSSPGMAAMLSLAVLEACSFPAALEHCRDQGRCEPRLASLTTSVGALDPPFAPATTSYQLVLPSGSSSVSLTPSVSEPASVSVEVAGVAIASGTPSPELPVALASQTVDVTVTGLASLKTTYSVVIRRELPVYVKASNTRASDQFGSAIALSSDGTTLVVGAWGEGSSSGEVYVFVRVGSTWSQQAALQASNPAQGDRFGGSLAVSADGSSVAVGAWGKGLSTGAVYVFARAGSTWSQQALFQASNPGQGDRFGCAVAMGNDQAHNRTILLVGAPGEDSAATGIDGDQTNNGAVDSGAVYVFTLTGSIWTQAAYLKASNTGAGDGFGSALALSGSGLSAVVGAPSEDSSATGLGGDQASNAATDSGAVYLFALAGSAWSQQAYLKASNTGPGDDFGVSVALSKDGMTLAVGADHESAASVGVGGAEANDDAPRSGAVYVFARSGSSWAQGAYVKASNTGSGDLFGASIALSASGSMLEVGALDEGSSAVGVNGAQGDNGAAQSGAIYVFSRDGSGSTWAQDAYVKATNTSPGALFGTSVALSSDGAMVIAGAPGERSSATGINGDSTSVGAPMSGAVYVY